MPRSSIKICLLALLMSPILVVSQRPIKKTSSQIFSDLQRLNFLGSVLYIAAHPDDENTRLISYMVEEKHARTGYLSLTRGDGGQNLIGPQLRDQLGLIRTEELLEARKIDGGQQFFTRANDFGYSKNPDETLSIWNREEVLSDVIYVIRTFRPDVIINRFDARTPGTTHGHHTSSAILSLEAFDKAGDSKVFPHQLGFVQPWQPKRVYFNTSWFFYGGKENFEKMDKSSLTGFDTGVYYPLLGKSKQEIAALSRSSHRSQGFGSTGTRGSEMEYLEFLKGEKPKDPQNIFEGIDTSWNRLKNGAVIGKMVENIINNFDFAKPYKSVSDLAITYEMVENTSDPFWKKIKLKEIEDLIAECSGLYLEATSATAQASPGNTIKVKVEATNRSTAVVKLISTKPSSGIIVDKNLVLDNNKNNVFELDITLPQNMSYTQPYWLEHAGTVGMYRVDDAKIIGTPDIIRSLKVDVKLLVDKIPISIERPIVFKYNDEVKGEMYQPLDIVPEITISPLTAVSIFGDKTSKIISAKVTANTDNCNGKLSIEVPKGWKTSPSEYDFELSKNNDSKSFDFTLTPPVGGSEGVAKFSATCNGKLFEKEMLTIDYEHIPKAHVLKASTSKLIKLDIKIGNERIGYIMGAGDQIPESLREMGYKVDILVAENLSPQVLSNYEVVITGIRAYNTVNALANKQQTLFDFVKSGKTMIVQYNTTADLITKELAPFPLTISRDRVTEEDAQVTFLDPKNKLLNFPNRITSADFKGWTQEQGLYYPNDWDKAFTPVIAAHDKGEDDKKGAILVADYGKGKYIYTGLSFFRELPEGVPGAFRLMANLISASTKQ